MSLRLKRSILLDVAPLDLTSSFTSSSIFCKTHQYIAGHIANTQPTIMGQNEISLASTIVADVLDDISNRHPNATRLAFEFASYAESLLSRISRYQSTNSDTRSRTSLGLTRPSVSHLQHTIERLAAKYNPSNRLKMGTCASSCSNRAQSFPQIEDHPTHTNACTGTESPSATIPEQHSVSAAPPSYEDIYPLGLATPDPQRKPRRPIESPSYPEQQQPMKCFSIASTSPTETKHSRTKSETSNSSRESSPTRRPGEMDATLSNYPVQGELPGCPGPCRGDSGRPSVDGIGGAGSG
jgi:hypothetical protein